ncbi:MAG TPA: hypothetical protein VEA44_16555 [Caulobacter sp.]|nr:hypothetical protein [Caulobacter sp.]
MRRRTLLLATLSLPLAACGLLPPEPLAIVCDADLVAALETAAKAWPGRRGAAVEVATDISERELGERMEALRGGLIATREPKQANRIQRLGLARLEHRWTREIAGGPVQLVATRGDYRSEQGAIAFAKWLASPEADRFVDAPAATPMRLTLWTAP